jgi:hypothetical protein
VSTRGVGLGAHAPGLADLEEHDCGGSDVED